MSRYNTFNIATMLYLVNAEDEDMDGDGNNDTNDSTNTTFDTVVTAAATGDNDVQHGIDDN